MRKLHHPRPEEITVEGILYALADPVRVQIFTRLAASECAQNCSKFLNVLEQAPLAKSTLSQHFRILREAGLIRSERRGVELINSTRCAELAERFGPMVQSIISAYERQKIEAAESTPRTAIDKDAAPV
ncbi:helix-turn-helix transcriptional regulator [Methylosinus sp. RM1]|uniref:ArsR/SmtB family transcription factor n=1 Tax=Methylosinus sp. RM1 TaxID=2583817 RepID=UPI00140C49D9|nr:helix-turn-helix domain-containing protein [Methylosinus sp. RM1]